MIKLNYLFEKNAIHNKSESVVSLVQFSGTKNNIKTEKRKLNISIAIDISGSMDVAIKTERVLKTRKVLKNRNPYINIPMFDILKENYWDKKEYEIEEEYVDEQYYEYVSSIKKIDQAKNAAVKAIEKMQLGDYISIVCFDDNVNVLVDATKITNKNKKQIIEKIKSIKVGGSTNLHDGWLKSATEVAKNISEKYINRVILITDGQANHGIINPKEIESNVFKLYQKSISTTCMGIGEGFNEKLLESMSNSGGGNFYFIEKDQELESMFENEFSGFSNVVATEITLQFIPSQSSIKKQLNAFIEKDGKFLIGSLLNEKSLDILFDLNIKVKKSQKSLNIGKFIFEFKNENGEKESKELELIIPIVNKEVWDDMEYNKEVKVQETLMIVANNKFEMAEAINNGNVEYAKNLMSASANTISASGYFDDRLTKETANLNATLSASDNMSSENLKKTILYQSYQTRTNK